MAAEDNLQESGGLGKEAIDRAFGATNRKKLIDRYFGEHASGAIAAADAWAHVYRLLLWSDPTIGLAHCYESDKSQPGRLWYGRSLAFHDWVANGLAVAPADLAKSIDWLFSTACKDLTAAVLRKEARLAEAAMDQRALYAGQGFPEPGDDPELAALIGEALKPYLTAIPSEDAWRAVTQQVRSYLAVQNKRKNLVGEGFEDVLAQIVSRVCQGGDVEVCARRLLYEIPGFNRARSGGKENKVDLSIVQKSMRTIVTAKWSVRADREKQFPADYEEYCNAESSNQKFEYVFVTNEFDPARLMRACDSLYRNNPMFDHVVHINTDAVRAAYGKAGTEGKRDSSWRRVIGHIESGRLTSLGNWLEMLSKR